MLSNNTYLQQSSSSQSQPSGISHLPTVKTTAMAQETAATRGLNTEDALFPHHACLHWSNNSDFKHAIYSLLLLSRLHLLLKLFLFVKGFARCKTQFPSTMSKRNNGLPFLHYLEINDIALCIISFVHESFSRLNCDNAYETSVCGVSREEREVVLYKDLFYHIYLTFLP